MSATPKVAAIPRASASASARRTANGLMSVACTW